tara:strand:+ start:638 stop:979 length:342 start_codon:yes stop_codon:yes gene_type:complete
MTTIITRSKTAKVAADAFAKKKEEKIYTTRQTRSSQKNLHWSSNEDLSTYYFIHYANKFLTNSDGTLNYNKAVPLLNELFYMNGNPFGSQTRHPLLWHYPSVASLKKKRDGSK